MMNSALACVCLVPPVLGAAALAVAHIRQREWWRTLMWAALPVGLGLAGLGTVGGDPGVAALCITGSALVVTVAWIVEVRARRQSATKGQPETPIL